MPDKRSTYKTTSEADALIERINAARPLDRRTVADAINYALRFTAQHDQEVNEMYETFDAKRLYDGVNHGLPKGAQVKLSDGALGHVVEGNPERSLVAYTPDRLTGCSEARDWFSNDTLQVKA